jgi:glycosyltransferase
MKISVVTTCFNSERTIAYTVESFVRQTYPNKEMVIIDGLSRDRTLDIVRSFKSDDIRIFSERDHGIWDAMNRGLKAYSGDAMGYLNSDDAFHDSKALERIADGLANADIVYGDIDVVTDHQSKRVVRTWKAGSYRQGAFYRGWMPPHPAFYIRRKIAEAVGFFELDYKVSSDYDYILRAMELYHPRIAYAPHTLVDFMTGGNSTKSIWRFVEGNLECLRSRRQHLKSSFVDLALVLKPIRKLPQFHWFS